MSDFGFSVVECPRWDKLKWPDIQRCSALSENQVPSEYLKLDTQTLQQQKITIDFWKSCPFILATLSKERPQLFWSSQTLSVDLLQNTLHCFHSSLTAKGQNCECLRNWMKFRPRFKLCGGPLPISWAILKPQIWILAKPCRTLGPNLHFMVQAHLYPIQNRLMSCWM